MKIIAIKNGEDDIREVDHYESLDMPFGYSRCHMQRVAVPVLKDGEEYTYTIDGRCIIYDVMAD